LLNLKKFAKKKRIRKFLYKKKIFKSYYAFKLRNARKHRFRTRKFFLKFFLKFRKFRNNSNVLKLKYFFKNNSFIRKILHKNFIALKYNIILKNKLKRFRLRRKFKFKRKRKKQYRKKLLQFGERRDIYKLGFKKLYKFIGKKLVFNKNIINFNNFANFKIKKKLYKSVKFGKLYYKPLNFTDKCSIFKNFKEGFLTKNIKKYYNCNNKRNLYTDSLYFLNNFCFYQTKFCFYDYKKFLAADIVKLIIFNWRLKKRKNKKIFKIRSKKLNIYYNIQKSIPLKRKKVRLNVIKKYTETGLYVRDYFLSKMFRLFKVYKNMIFLLKKKALNSKVKSIIFKNHNYFLVMIKFVKTLNTDIKFYFNKRMLLNRNFKIDRFIKKKSKTKYFNEKSSTKVFKKKIVNAAKKKAKNFVNMSIYLRQPPLKNQ